MKPSSYTPLLAQLDRECGRHSNIPECCIAFWVQTWWPLVLQSNAESAAFIRARTACIKASGVQFRHVPCDACLAAGKVVRVARCPPDCPLARLKAHRP